MWKIIEYDSYTPIF